MKKILLFTILLSSIQLIAQNDKNNTTMRVVGGTNAEVGDYPWMVSLNMNDGTAGCGASLIAPQWVLTAGHCITNDLGFPGIPLIDGVIINSIINDGSSLASFSELIDMEEIITHEDYAGIFGGGNGPDISLIRLKEPSTITPIEIATFSDSLSYGHLETGRVLGWGRSEVDDQPSDTLKTAEVIFFSPDSCATLYQAAANSLYDANEGGNICAGYLSGTTPAGAASGDSGGPLVFQTANGTYKQVGVVSGGESQITTEDFPGIFTLVPKYTTWIDSIITNYELPTAITEIEEKSLSIVHFAGRHISIKGMNEQSEYNINTYNISGQLVWSNQTKGSENVQIPVFEYNPGIYIVKIQNRTEGFLSTEKIVIQ